MAVYLSPLGYFTDQEIIMIFRMSYMIMGKHLGMFSLNNNAIVSGAMVCGDAIFISYAFSYS